MSKMCDKRSLNFCGRITLLLSICVILCVMMIQVWSYYYSLVTQMDEMVLESPQVYGVLDICDGNVKQSWNIDECEHTERSLVCKLMGIDPTGRTLFVDTNGHTDVFVNESSLIINPFDACVRIMLWIFPW